MRTIVFRVHDPFCKADIRRLSDAWKQQGGRVSYGILAEIPEEPEHMLVVTDSLQEVEYALNHRMAVVYYEKPGSVPYIGDVDMVVQGFEEIDIRFLEFVYRRSRGLPWPIADTRRLFLRESVMEDLQAFSRIYGQPGMTDYIDLPEFWGADGEETFRQYIRQAYRFRNYGLWTVIEKAGGQIIGRAGIESRNYQGSNVLEVGYLIAKPWQRKGYGMEAARAVERAAVGLIGAECLYAFICPQNEPSIHLIQKLGYNRLKGHTEDGLTVWRKWLKEENASA